MRILLMCVVQILVVKHIVTAFKPKLTPAKTKNVNIGIFLEDDYQYQVSVSAVESAVEQMNRLKTEYFVKKHLFLVKRKHAFEAGQLVCDLVENDVAAIFSSTSPEISELLQSVASNLQIPSFHVWDIKSASYPNDLETPDSTLINLHPTPHSLSMAVSTVLREQEWKKYTIIYEDEKNLMKLKNTLNDMTSAAPKVTYRKIEPGPNYTLFKQIKKSGEIQIVLDCHVNHILDILQTARKFKLLEEYHSYFIINLDTDTLDWSGFSGVNSTIKTLKLINTNTDTYNRVIGEWKSWNIPVQTRAALLFDALNIFITSFTAKYVKEAYFPKKLNCDGDDVSLHGLKFIEYVKNKTFTTGALSQPLSGNLQFDISGDRTSYKLQVLESSKSPIEFNFHVAGIWNSDNPEVIETKITTQERVQKELEGKNFKIVSRLGPPYLMESEGKYVGYSNDLMTEICLILNCSFSFHLVPDGRYGEYDPVKKEWNGLIRQLLDRKADLAVCDLTMTYERRKAVDFTMPFMTLGISILYAKAVKEPPELLSFSHPLSLSIWVYVSMAYLFVSLIIFLVARINPNDWENPHPCDPCPQELENIWTFRNCYWLTMGSIMNQGCDILPKGISTRMVAAMWWFFALIMTATYTANLAAFLTMQRMGPSIESAEDLASQTKIKYGCLAGGSTCGFFRDSNFSTYHRMWVQMEQADPSVFEKTNRDGVKRVINGTRKYAFLMESTAIEYEMERNCDLIQVGNWLDSKGYGIAMPVNFQYRKRINEAILKMQESGKLRELKKKWWKQMNGGGQCDEQEASAGEEAAAELGLENVGGVFVVLTAGILLALIIAVCEFLWNVRKVAVVERITLEEAFRKEIKFAMNIWAREKAVRRANITPESRNS